MDVVIEIQNKSLVEKLKELVRLDRKLTALSVEISGVGIESGIAGEIGIHLYKAGIGVATARLVHRPDGWFLTCCGEEEKVPTDSPEFEKMYENWRGEDAAYDMAYGMITRAAGYVFSIIVLSDKDQCES